MPDLGTHLAVGYLLAPARRLRPAAAVLFLVGCTWPDLLTRMPQVVVDAVSLEAGRHLLEFLRPLHSPLPYLLVCYLCSVLFVPALRGTAFRALAAGGLLHMALDFLQIPGFDPGFQEVSSPNYVWLFPFSRRDFQWGLFGPEASLYALPILAGAALVKARLSARPRPPRHRESGRSGGVP